MEDGHYFQWLNNNFVVGERSELITNKHGYDTVGMEEDMFGIFKKKKCKPLTMYKVEYCEQEQMYYGFERCARSRFAPFVKVRNTWSNSLECSKERLDAIIRRRETSKSIEY